MIYITLIPVILGSIYFICRQEKSEKTIKIVLIMVLAIIFMLVLIEFRVWLNCI